MPSLGRTRRSPVVLTKTDVTNVVDRGGVMKFLTAIQDERFSSDLPGSAGERARKLFRAGVYMILTTAAAGVAVAAEENPANWPVYHGKDKSSRFSALDSINKTNVKRLKVAWIHQPGEITGGLQAT